MKLSGRFIPGQTTQIIDPEGEEIFGLSFPEIRRRYGELGELVTADMLRYPWAWCHREMQIP